MGNIILNKPVTVNKSILPYTGARAVNGTAIASSRWLTDLLPATLSVDLGALYFVNRWVVKHPSMLAGWSQPTGAYANANYALQVSSDGVNWGTISSVMSNTAPSTDQTFDPPVLYRYYRLQVTKGLGINNQTVSVLDFELYQAYSALLTNLTISAGTLSPDFSRTVYAYSTTINADTESIIISPTAFSPTANIMVNNVRVLSGGSTTVALTSGVNTITVNVTDNTEVKKYTITVMRSSNNLSNLTAQTANGANVPFTPSFDKATLNYTATVSNDVTSITVTPTAESSSASITVNNAAVQSGQASQTINLNVGSNDINVAVNAGGQTKTYKLTVTRADSTYLTALTVNSGSTGIRMSPSFAKTTLEYSATVPFDISSVQVTPTAESAAVSITVNGSTVTSGQASSAIGLNIGSNDINVVVSSGGATTSYKITITRVDTSLKDLVLKVSPGSTTINYTPGFQQATLAYTADKLTKPGVSITPTASLSGSTITVGGTPVNSGSSTVKQIGQGTSHVLIVVTNSGVSTTYDITFVK